MLTAMSRTSGAPRRLAIAARLLGSVAASIAITVLITTGLAIASTGALGNPAQVTPVGYGAQGFSLGESCANYRDAQEMGINQDNAAYLLAASRDRNLPDRVGDSLRSIAVSTDPTALRPVRAEISRFFNGACNNPRDPIGTACTLLVTLRQAPLVQARLVAGQMHYALADGLNSGEVDASLGDALAVIVASPLQPSAAEQEEIEAANDEIDRNLSSQCGTNGVTQGVALAATGLSETSTLISLIGFFLIFFGWSLTRMTHHLAPS